MGNNVWQKDLYETEKNHWWFQSRRDIVADVFWRKRSATKRKPEILSVGVGTGIELDYLKTYGNVTGIDLSDDLIELCAKQGHTVLKQDILTCDLPSDSFDVIFAMDIIEHVKDHERAYAQLIRMLKPGGHLVVTVPACQFLWSALDEAGEFPHHRRYSKKTLTELINTQSVTIEKLSYYNFFLFPLAYATRKLKTNVSTQVGIPNKLVNGALRTIFTAEKYFLRVGRFPIGVSLLAVVRKTK